MRIIRMERFVPYFLEKFKGKPTYPGDSTDPHNGCFFHTSIRRPHGQMLISSTLGIWILVFDPVDMPEILKCAQKAIVPPHRDFVIVIINSDDVAYIPNSFKTVVFLCAFCQGRTTCTSFSRTMGHTPDMPHL